jgi:hypothetical protein
MGCEGEDEATRAVLGFSVAGEEILSLEGFASLSEYLTSLGHPTEGGPAPVLLGLEDVECPLERGRHAQTRKRSFTYCRKLVQG